jgi:hypothetical protein
MLNLELKSLFVSNIWALLPDETMSCSLQSPRRLMLSRDKKEGAPLTGRAPFLYWMGLPHREAYTLTATTSRIRSAVETHCRDTCHIFW